MGFKISTSTKVSNVSSTIFSLSIRLRTEVNYACLVIKLLKLKPKGKVTWYPVHHREPLAILAKIKYDQETRVSKNHIYVNAWNRSIWSLIKNALHIIVILFFSLFYFKKKIASTKLGPDWATISPIYLPIHTQSSKQIKSKQLGVKLSTINIPMIKQMHYRCPWTIMLLKVDWLISVPYWYLFYLDINVKMKVS